MPLLQVMLLKLIEPVQGFEQVLTRLSTLLTPLPPLQLTTAAAIATASPHGARGLDVGRWTLHASTTARPAM